MRFSVATGTNDDLFEDTLYSTASYNNLPTSHIELRQIAEQNTEKVRKEIRDRLLKGGSTNRNFEVGSVVVLSIPRIDRNIVDRPLLPCKIIEKPNGKYRLGCASGILEVTYDANELNLVKTADFPELENIPPQRITLREAARSQSVVGVVSGRQTKCICKGTCIDSRCGCKKAKQKCNERCHKTNSSCRNY